MTSALLEGFFVSFGLIVAIGPQNAFLLRQSIKREYSLPIALFCILSDMTLIGAGVMGVGHVLQDNGLIYHLIGWGGVAFLLWFAFSSAKGVLKAEAMDLDTGPAHHQYSLAKALGIAAAITWLNPHVYIDTLVLIGGVSLKFETLDDRFGFMLGGWCASIAWFGLLAFAGRRLAPFFKRPLTWQILDGLITLIMLTVAALLALSLV